jgi:hypothetical protein
MLHRYAAPNKAKDLRLYACCLSFLPTLFTFINIRESVDKHYNHIIIVITTTTTT